MKNCLSPVKNETELVEELEELNEVVSQEYLDNLVEPATNYNNEGEEEEEEEEGQAKEKPKENLTDAKTYKTFNGISLFISDSANKHSPLFPINGIIKYADNIVFATNVSFRDGVQLSDEFIKSHLSKKPETPDVAIDKSRLVYIVFLPQYIMQKLQKIKTRKKSYTDRQSTDTYNIIETYIYDSISKFTNKEVAHLTFVGP